MVKVVKFGGSSLASAKQFEKVGSIIRGEEARRYVVPSAPGKRFDGDTKVTDLLFKAYSIATRDEYDEDEFEASMNEIFNRFKEIISGLKLDLDLSDEFKEIKTNFLKKIGRDYAASRGEYLNGLIMAKYLDYEFIDAADVILFHRSGRLNDKKTNKILSTKLKEVRKAVIPGFYGADKNGKIITFSRGGSDITGSIVSKACRADVYENWTDVNGFLVADPRIVNDPKPIDAITYRELRELSYMGATVLHEASVFPIMKEGIPINVRNTNNPQDEGTFIVEGTTRKPKYTITGIAGKKDIASVTIEKSMMNYEIGFCRKVLEVFEENNLSIEHMPSGIDTMTILLNAENFAKKEQKVVAGIHRAVEPDLVELESDLALIAVVGRGMKQTRGTSARIFSALAHAHINVRMIDQGSSELNIIVGVRNHDFENAIRALYDCFVNSTI
ncbi:MAG: aspartate kinase [Lachnospiraceae bacterium]|nr:aspartate kinase [Lachnospiraceae bacterium]